MTLLKNRAGLRSDSFLCTNNRRDSVRRRKGDNRRNYKRAFVIGYMIDIKSESLWENHLRQYNDLIG